MRFTENLFDRARLTLGGATYISCKLININRDDKSRFKCSFGAEDVGASGRPGQVVYCGVLRDSFHTSLRCVENRLYIEGFVL